MKTRSSTLTLTGDELKFDAVTDSGHTILIDSDGVTGARPTELLGIALAGCTSMDVISILRKKRQAVDRYEVRVTSHQVDEPPHNFVLVEVEHRFEGERSTLRGRRARHRALVREVLLGGRHARRGHGRGAATGTGSGGRTAPS